MKRDIKTLNPLFTELIEPVIKIPVEPKGNIVEEKTVVDSKTVITSKTIISRVDEKKYDAELTMYFKNRSSLENALQSLYIITWGKCSKLMKNRLEAGQRFKIIKDNGVIAKLLTEIRGVSNEGEVSSNVYDALDKIKRRYYNYYQGDNDSNMKHIQALNALVASIEHHGGNIWLDEGFLEHEKKYPEQTGFSNGDYQYIMKQKVMATAMIKRANRTRYVDVIANMRREYSCELNTYPTTIEQAHNILNKHEAFFKLK